MPPKSLFAASLIGAALAAACAGGPRTASVPAGLTYECDRGGLATIAFNGGGYLPEASVWGASANGERAQVPRSAAELSYDGRKHEMLAEVAPSGLRYRSAAKVDEDHYLVWTSGTADGEAGVEDAALTLRRAVEAGESGEREIARCARSGRAQGAAAPHQEREATRGKEDPHRR